MAKQSMGEIIAHLRKEKGLTQKELADQLHITDKAVSKWERNLACPDVNSIPQLAEILGVSVEVLLNSSTPESTQKHETDHIIDLILKGVPLAMGVAVAVTAQMKAIDLHSGLTMLGIGLCCLGIDRLKHSGDF